MTVAMMLLGDGEPPPTAGLVAKLAGGDPADYKMPGIVLHLLYGVVVGAIFVVAVPLLGLGLDSLPVTVGLGVAYGLVLMIGGMAFWMRTVIGREPDRDTMQTFDVVRVLYGLGLSAFVGAGVMA